MTAEPSPPPPSHPDARDTGKVIWITGLSGSGKTTLATALTHRLRADDQAVVLLDGDELREVFGAAGLAHDRRARMKLAGQYAHLCRVIAAQGVIVVIATISLFKEIHAWNRAHLPGYFEIYLHVELDELRRRDPKGIYRLYHEGKLANVAGLDLAVDTPEAPDMRFDFPGAQSIDDMIATIMDSVPPIGK